MLMGHRGVSLSRPHTDIRKVNGPEYMAEAQKEGILMCRIEFQTGVDHHVKQRRRAAFPGGEGHDGTAGGMI